MELRTGWGAGRNGGPVHYKMFSSICGSLRTRCQYQQVCVHTCVRTHTHMHTTVTIKNISDVAQYPLGEEIQNTLRLRNTALENVRKRQEISGYYT